MSRAHSYFTPRQHRQPELDGSSEVVVPHRTGPRPVRRSLPEREDPYDLMPFLIGSHPARTYLNPRQPAQDPRRLIEDRPTGGSSTSSVASSSSPPPSQSAGRFRFIENDTSRNTRPTFRQPVLDSPPTPRYYEPRYSQPSYYESRYSQPPELESNFTKEEQEKIMKKLRKVLYNPHLSSIVRRLGTKYQVDGLKKSVETEEEGKRCAICLDDFDTKQYLMVTPCDHMFHEDCIVPWVKSQGKCPVCRYMICEPTAARENNTGRDAFERELMSIIWEFDRAI